MIHLSSKLPQYLAMEHTGTKESFDEIMGAFGLENGMFQPIDGHMFVDLGGIGPIPAGRFLVKETPRYGRVTWHVFDKDTLYDSFHVIEKEALK